MRPSIDDIAAQHSIPRSTLYAALKGTRLPGMKAIVALVQSWNGDVPEWLAKRGAVEQAMAARQTPNRPGRGHNVVDRDSGGLGTFAAELRALRDGLGTRAQTIDEISVRTGIPRSTLFAALSGKRLPSRRVVAALVQAWNADPAEWMAKRSAAEAPAATQSPSAHETRRISRQTLPGPAPPGGVVFRAMCDTADHGAAEFRVVTARRPDGEDALSVVIEPVATGATVTASFPVHDTVKTVTELVAALEGWLDSPSHHR